MSKRSRTTEREPEPQTITAAELDPPESDPPESGPPTADELGGGSGGDGGSG